MLGNMPHGVRNERLWSSAFARFVTAYGIDRLATALEISSPAVFHWIRGATAPKPAHAVIIQRLARESGVRLTLDQIYQHSRDLRAGETPSGGDELRDNGIRGNGSSAARAAAK
jgi:hypothetical protein